MDKNKYYISGHTELASNRLVHLLLPIQRSNNPTIQLFTLPTIQSSNHPTIQSFNYPNHQTIQPSNRPTIQSSNHPTNRVRQNISSLKSTVVYYIEKYTYCIQECTIIGYFQTLLPNIIHPLYNCFIAALCFLHCT